MTSDRKDPRRVFAVELVQRLSHDGYTAYFAGGCVRDELLGRRPKDYDIATDATPDQVRRVFGRRRTIPVGAAFGVVCVLGRKSAGEGMVEIATFRSDGDYHDGRHPDHVDFSSPQEDARRRDFTINGMFYDPLNDEVIDYVGGRHDLDQRLIRAIGDPAARFDEDHLRLMRAVRIATMLQFEIEPATLRAIQTHATLIGTVSGERIAVEFEATLASPSAVTGFWILAELGLLKEIVPELYEEHAAQATRPTTSAARMLEHFDGTDFRVSLCCVLAGIDDPQRRVDAAYSLVARLRLSNDIRDSILFAYQSLDTLIDADRLPWSRVQPLLVNRRADVALAFAECWVRAKGARTCGTEFCRKQRNLPPDRLNPTPLIDGRELKRLGVQPGPIYREVIEEVRRRQLDDQMTSPEDARQWVIQRLQLGASD